MRPSQSYSTLETLLDHPAAPLCRTGLVLTDRDNQTTLEVYLQWICLLVDLGYLLPESELLRDSRRLWLDITKVDVLELGNSFAECLESIRLRNFRGFKALCGKISSHLYRLIESDVLNCSSTGNVHSAKRLIQLFSYTGRLSLMDIDLTQSQLESYRQIEEAMPIQFDEKLIQSLNKIIRRWIGSFEPCPVIPRHGPGGIAEHGRCSLETKYNALSQDLMTRYAFGEAFWPMGTSKLERVSRTIFVPKSFKTFRTISMEPATLQFLQQGVWRAIERCVSANSYLRGHIGFEDQERNRQLAKKGSIDRDYATLDLSAASDSVSYDLVKKLFRGTWLLRYIVTTRSPWTKLPDGSLMKLKKFAPMGSSLCFPIETLVFASISELVTREHRVSGKYSVYGDDIIVPTQCVERSVQILTELGFYVNHSKSFSDPKCWFRESCGGEYLDGFDVTPMRVSRKYASEEQDVRIAKLISLANSAYLREFRTLRHFFLSKLRSLVKEVYFAPTSLLGDNYTNYHLKQRWSGTLHKYEVKANDALAKYLKKDVAKQDELIRYQHWLLSTVDRKTVGDGFKSVICRPTMLLAPVWREGVLEVDPLEALAQQTVANSRNPQK